MMRSACSGKPATSAPADGTRWLGRVAAPKLNSSGTVYGSLPVSIWKNIAPAAQMSVRPSCGPSRQRSGAMYTGVPAPGVVAFGLPCTLAVAGRSKREMPKSRILTRPSRSTSTLLGFKSRCTMPFLCA